MSKTLAPGYLATRSPVGAIHSGKGKLTPPNVEPRYNERSGLRQQEKQSHESGKLSTRTVPDLLQAAQ